MTVNWKKIKTESKYKNVKVVVDGRTFDSKKEAGWYQKLRLLERAGKILNLRRQVRFELQPGFRGPDGTWQRPITYVADFTYTDTGSGRTVVVDVKSAITEKNPVYRIKRKMLLFSNKDIVFREII